MWVCKYLHVFDNYLMEIQKKILKYQMENNNHEL